MVSVLMNRYWFGPKDESSGGIAGRLGILSWQGALVTLVCIGGAFEAEKYMTGNLRHLVAGALVVAFGLIYWRAYDKDAIT
jgi:hypothetical protein